MKSLTFSCLICALNLYFCSKVTKKGKSFSSSVEPQKVAPKAKGCSKVAEKNGDRKQLSSILRAQSGQAYIQTAWRLKWGGVGGGGGLQLDAVFGLQVDGPVTGGGAYWARAEGGGAYKRQFKINISISQPSHSSPLTHLFEIINNLDLSRDIRAGAAITCRLKGFCFLFRVNFNSFVEIFVSILQFTFVLRYRILQGRKMKVLSVVSFR